MRKSPGFTLTELILSTTVSALILIGIIGVSAQMVRFQVESTRKGDVTGWTLLSINQMNREVEQASVLDCPRPSGGSVPPYGNPCAGTDSPFMRGCTNFTRAAGYPPGQRMDPDPNLPTTAFFYCVPPNGTYANNLLRYAQVTSGMGARVCLIDPTCGAAPTGAQTLDVVSTNVYQIDPLTPFFRRADDVMGVELNYIVGIATQSAVAAKGPPMTGGPNPVHVRMNYKIGMNKAFQDPPVD